jgi:ABC-2 type transport system permease protein
VIDVSWPRIRAVFTKEMRDYRRNRFIVATMAVLPVVFTVAPVSLVLSAPSGLSHDALTKVTGVPLLQMMLIPTVAPGVLTAYSVVGEREQGTLEPVLTAPLRREEFLLGKALAALAPTLAIAYTVIGAFFACAALFASSDVAAAVFSGPKVAALLVFTPLLAVWAIWVGLAISARTADVRVAQQLGTLAALPALAVVSLMSFGVIPQKPPWVVGLAVALLIVDLRGWRLVSAMFDPERLVTGSKAGHEQVGRWGRVSRPGE